MRYEGFEPFINSDSRTLILGSFPSVKSREEGFYYGNRQNRFWRVLAECYLRPLPASIEEKKLLLTENKIALWDVVVRCEIRGSMDKDIQDPVIADLPALLADYPIERIFTNGSTAYRLFLRNFPALAERCVPLPSTSPANVKFSKQTWIDALTAGRA